MSVLSEKLAEGLPEDYPKPSPSPLRRALTVGAVGAAGVAGLTAANALGYIAAGAASRALLHTGVGKVLQSLPPEQQKAVMGGVLVAAGTAATASAALAATAGRAYARSYAERNSLRER